MPETATILPDRLAALATLAKGAMCACGCGLPAPLAQRNNARLGHAKGKALPRISGHNKKGTSDLSRYQLTDHGYITMCWDWSGTINHKGYGAVQVSKIKKNAHRALYEAVHGRVSSKLHIDHLCRNKLCVNPGHMEVVTPAENERRKRLCLKLIERMIDARDAA